MTNEYKNDNIQVTVSRLPGSKVKLQITVSPIAAKAAYKKAIKNVNKEVTLPGFRKGKAPDNFVVQNYKKHVDSEFSDVLLNTAFQEALDLTKIYPFGKKSIQQPQVKNLSPETGASITIEYETEPEIPEIDLNELTVKKIHQKPITPEQIQDVITQIQLSHAQWDNVSDDPIVEGDYVDLDIYNVDEDFAICEGTRFAVEKGKMGNWLLDLLLGKKVKDVVEGVSQNEHQHSAETCTDPTHDHSHDHEFKSTRCRITIKGHQRAKLPSLTDELAAKAGAPNVEELNKRIVQSLEKRAENSAKEKQRRQIEDQLIEKFTFDIPSSLTKEEKNQRIEHSISHLKRDKMSKEEYEKKAEELSRKIEKDLDNAYRLFFISSKIARDNKIEVSQEEIMQEFMNQMVNQDSSIIDPNMQPEEIRSRLQSYLITQKAKDLMIQKAKQID